MSTRAVQDMPVSDQGVRLPSPQNFQPYLLPGSFTDPFWQEAAARVLAPSIMARQVTEVRRTDLEKRLVEDIVYADIYGEALRAYLEQRAKLLEWQRKFRVSAGLSSILKACPPEPVDPAKTMKSPPETLAVMHGPKPIIAALDDLCRARFVSLRIENDQAWLAPTLLLLKRLRRT